MPKVALNIFKVGEEYRAVMQKGENPAPISMGTVVYQDGEEFKSTSVKDIKDAREIMRKLQQKAQKWARENGIPFVHNLDINPYH